MTARTSYTERLREQLLRRDREEHGGRDFPVPDDPARWDWTGKILKARQVLEDPDATDEQRADASRWLRAHSGTSQAPLSWGE